MINARGNRNLNYKNSTCIKECLLAVNIDLTKLFFKKYLPLSK